MSLVRTQNYYQKAFNYVYESYNDIVYINRLEWPQEELNFMANLTRNEMLSNAFAMQSGSTTESRISPTRS